MGKRYFICVCGLKCNANRKYIDNHLISDEHNKRFIEISIENERNKFEKKINKLNKNRKNISDNLFDYKCYKYNIAFDHINLKKKLLSVCHYEIIDEWFIILKICDFNFKFTEIKIKILSKD